MLAEALTALAAAGGTALVEAATSDAWEKAKAGFAKLIGRGDRQRVTVIEGRLENTRAELLPLRGAELERVRTARAAEWTTRLRDTLEEAPESADALRGVLAELAAAGVTVTGGRNLVVHGTISNTATAGGIAAGVIHGNVNVSPNPPKPKADPR